MSTIPSSTNQGARAGGADAVAATPAASVSTQTPTVRRPTGSAWDVKSMYLDIKYEPKYPLKVGTDTRIHDAFDVKPLGCTLLVPACICLATCADGRSLLTDTTYAGIEKGACAANALVQAIVHFGGPHFLLALHNAIKAHVDAGSNVKFMHALDEIVGQMIAWRGPVRKEFVLLFLDALESAVSPLDKLEPAGSPSRGSPSDESEPADPPIQLTFHKLWARFQAIILAPPNHDMLATSSSSSTAPPVVPYTPPFAAVSVDPELAPGSCVDVQALIAEHFAHVHAEQLPAFIAVDLSVSHFADGRPRKYTLANFGHFAVKGVMYVLRTFVRHLGPVVPRVTGKDRRGKDIVERGHLVVFVHSMRQQRFMVLDDESVYEGVPEHAVVNYFEELATYVRADMAGAQVAEEANEGKVDMGQGEQAGEEGAVGGGEDAMDTSA
ncbi:hypothetical protein BCR44DRAFT_406399 [Catenaria anguillulae PL171]|uniref:Uncharacterized protein n=1 Tax=Catenaria anguillulae PL171 TaxID=765915 RepID=A0A1Y2HVF6_9FUNG|nr:hypothetical protein BCR44DRAFT_406399 [Catenaria anguillulae PL171]